MDELLEVLGDPSTADKDTPFAELGDLIARADAYDPLPHQNDATAFQPTSSRRWRDGGGVSAGGRLLEMGRGYRLSVVAMHGDFDPTPGKV